MDTLGLIKKILGICDTRLPADPEAWTRTGSLLTLDLSKLPELQEHGGAIRLEGKGLEKRIFVIRGEGDAYHAMENKCTHMGRRLDPGSKPGTVTCCSVSGSTFDCSGTPVAGAAKRPVHHFAVETRDHVLVIDMAS